MKIKINKKWREEMLKFFITMSVFILFFLPAKSFAEEKQQDQNLPEWLTRINYGIDIGTDQKPRWYFETVQPLY